MLNAPSPKKAKVEAIIISKVQKAIAISSDSESESELESELIFSYSYPDKDQLFIVTKEKAYKTEYVYLPQLPNTLINLIKIINHHTKSRPVLAKKFLIVGE